MTIFILLALCWMSVPPWVKSQVTVPINATNHKMLRVLVLLPRKSGEYKFPFGTEMCGAAVLKAIEDIENGPLLPGYTITADFADSSCNGVQGIGQAHEHFETNDYNAVFGPACSQVCRSVGRLAAYLNTPVFTGVCQGTEMTAKTEFTTLSRFLATFEMTGFAISNFLLSFNWRRVGIIWETFTDIIWLLTKNGLHYAMTESNITIAESTMVKSDGDLEKALLDTAKVSRVIIMAVHGETFRKLMELVHKHGFHTGDYIFMAIPYYKQKKTFGDFSWYHNDSLDATIKETYPAAFFFWYYTRDVSPEYIEFEDYVKNRSATEFQYYYGENEEVPYPAANLYEATLLYATAANETLEEGGSLLDGRNLSQRLWNRSFPSITGGVDLNANGDRNQAYKITHLQDINSGIIETIGAYFTSNMSLDIVVSGINWPGGRASPPPDTPPCGFDGEFCQEDPHAAMKRIIAIFIGVLSGILILSTIIVIGVYKRMQWEKEIADMKWKVNMEDLILTKAGITGSRRALSTFSLKTSSSVASMEQRFTHTVMYKGLNIAVHYVDHIKEVDLSNKKFLLEMKQLSDLSHPNLVRFMGATVSPVAVLTEYCTKGSLQDLLENDDIQLDLTFKCSLLLDVIEGLTFLQDSYLKCHGNLKSSNCLVDGRFVVKLSKYGIPDWYNRPEKQAKDFLWTAPELLTSDTSSLPGTGSGDIYSLGVIAQEVVARQGAFYISDKTYSPEEMIRRVRACKSPPLRPSTSNLDCNQEMIDMIKRCWTQQAADRPSLSEIKAVVRNVSGIKHKNLSILDTLLSRMEHYANNLEELVEERTASYLEEKKRAEDLLHRLLPPSIADEIQTRGAVDPVSYEMVTIYFSDIVEFTPLCQSSTPMQVVTFLNDLYTCFDGIIARFDVYKVETIGDAYMAVSGLPKPNGNKHAAEISLMSLTLLNAMKTFRIRHQPDRKMLVRIGLHSGPCVAGVVGLTMPRYCLFGDTVNTASRMESTGEALRIHVSPQAKLAMDQHEGFELEERGTMPIKGKGNMTTYWLLSGPPDERCTVN